MTRKKRFLHILTASLLFLSTPVFAEKISLVTLDWPPLTDSKMADGGAITKQITDAFKTQNIEVEVTFMPWARALEAIQKGEYAGIFPAYRSKEREKIYDISDPIQTLKVGFIKLKKTKIDYQLNSNNLNETYDIFKKNNYKIGIIKSYSNEEIFDKRTDLHKVAYGSDEQAVKAIRTNKIDMYFGDSVFYKDYLAKNAPNELDNFEFIEPAVLEKGLYLLFPKNKANSKHLHEVFNAGLKKIRTQK